LQYKKPLSPWGNGFLRPGRTVSTRRGAVSS
jgi:hypothetical protein